MDFGSMGFGLLVQKFLNIECAFSSLGGGNVSGIIAILYFG